ncbi:hypothetical protein OG288_15850 [Streptomyces tauricus]|uniref:Scaffolding protein n=1 Tax=Streptomyces tauricus TaxID=68274 RepID=A0ABZ1JE18_9ACTN|nr:hypothetical protein [Streptomyces tauricus]
MAIEEIDNTTDGFEDDTYNEGADETTSENTDDWTPPTREDYEKLLADKRKATNEAVKRKQLLREHGIDLATGRRVGDTSSEDDGDKVSKTDHETVISQLKSRTAALLFEVPTALTEAGWNGNKRLFRHLDLDAVTIDDEGTAGLVEQIEELKGEFPEFFKRTRTPAPPAGAVGAGKKQAGSSDSSTWDGFRDEFYGRK